AAEVFATFAENVLPFDAGAAALYPLVVTTRDRLGRPIDGFDAQIASICRSAGMALATRNVKDFDHTGVDVINPWDGP
ncbi:MAG: VapC toxin family PIN domain ribonuclease, partial [Acidimicrobiales bacterium]